MTDKNIFSTIYLSANSAKGPFNLIILLKIMIKKPPPVCLGILSTHYKEHDQKRMLEEKRAAEICDFKTGSQVGVHHQNLKMMTFQMFYSYIHIVLF